MSRLSPEARAERAAAELDAYVARVVAAAPPLSECSPEAQAAVRALGEWTSDVDSRHRAAS